MIRFIDVMHTDYFRERGKSTGISRMRNFSERLKRVRETLNMDVEPFAQACGVKKTAQYNYESGERSPNAEYFEKLAALGVDIHQLITGRPLSRSGGAAEAVPVQYSPVDMALAEITELKLSLADAEMLLALARHLSKKT